MSEPIELNDAELKVRVRHAWAKAAGARKVTLTSSDVTGEWTIKSKKGSAVVTFKESAKVADIVKKFKAALKGI